MPYDGPPPSRRSTFFPVSLIRLATMTPAGPEPITITSHTVVAHVLGSMGEAKTKPKAWRRRREKKKAAMMECEMWGEDERDG